MIGDSQQMELFKILVPGLAQQAEARAFPQNGAKNAKQASQGHRAGDWICVKCSNLNYSFRNRCNRCQVQTKKQNLLDNLLLINSDMHLPEAADENRPHKDQSPFTPKTAAQKTASKRVPFGDLTNKTEPSELKNQVFKSKQNKQVDSKASQWTPFSNSSKPLRKLSNNMGKDQERHGSEERPEQNFRGFNSVLLLEKNLETPKKDKNMARVEAEGLESPENGKNVTKYLFDSEQKDRKKAVEQYPVISEFNPEGQTQLIDILFDILQSEEDGQGNQRPGVSQQFKFIN